MQIVALKHLEVAGFGQLVAAGIGEGFRFLGRLRNDWVKGTNTFGNKGEALFGVIDKGMIIAIGGINVDPYKNDPLVGRIRHLYVHPEFRREGVGKLLVKHILEQSRTYFKLYTLRTENDIAAGFYERLGFVKVVNSGTDTHHYKRQ